MRKRGGKVSDMSIEQAILGELGATSLSTETKSELFNLLRKEYKINKELDEIVNDSIESDIIKFEKIEKK